MEEIEAKLTPSGTQKMAKSVAEEHDIFWEEKGKLTHPI
jgi:hypothetical protein